MGNHVPAFRPANTKKQATPLKTTIGDKGKDSVPSFKTKGSTTPKQPTPFSKETVSYGKVKSMEGHRAGFTQKNFTKKASIIKSNHGPSMKEKG